MAKELYKKLKLLREQRHFSQEQLADVLGISRPTYMQIEKGERELTISEARKLASIFDISLEDFLAGREGVNPVVTIPKKKKKNINKTNKKKKKKFWNFFFFFFFFLGVFFLVFFFFFFFSSLFSFW